MFNIKTLVAVAALAVAGTASATVFTPSYTGAGNLGGEMSFTVFSATAQASFIFDTGIMLSDFRASALAGTNASPYTLSYNLSANTEFQSFLSRVASSGATDIGFSFFGGDNSGSTFANQRSMISTISNSGDATVVTNGNMADSMNNITNNYLAKVNNDLRFQGAANANASGTFVKGAGGNGYFLETLKADFVKFQPTDGAVGESVGVYNFERSSTSSGGDAIETKIGDASLGKNASGQYVFNFSTPVAPVATVPEPESYALMVAGLLVVGATAARRRAK